MGLVNSRSCLPSDFSSAEDARCCLGKHTSASSSSLSSSFRCQPSAADDASCFSACVDRAGEGLTSHLPRQRMRRSGRLRQWQRLARFTIASAALLATSFGGSSTAVAADSSFLAFGAARGLQPRADSPSSRIALRVSRGEAAARKHAEQRNLERPSRGIQREDVDLRFSRSSGPGGQNVNMVETKVEARFHVESCFLPTWVKQALRRQQANRINADGTLVVSASEERTQHDNVRIVMEKLQAMIDKAAVKQAAPDKNKVKKMTKIRKAASKKRIEDKRFKSEKKNAKMKYHHDR
eukprot:TRINITY_DN41099_c0_g1_i1.p1 TRINITY_DN41099_c0_g1~~TRINITY_DN41099_c0_g1_i1.p1  ORF type:complete len:306 (+),score=75.77 TRINITY_DN41099_c0_g1_i1:36-920(+)